MRDRRRVLWVAGSRSELLVLGPLFKSFYRPGPPQSDLHWFMTTGDQGMPLYQSLDLLDLIPHDRAEIRPPNEDPAIRLYGIMQTVEQAARRHRATHVVFCGFQTTAAAAAQVTLGRECAGAWLQLPDAAGLLRRLLWERGITAMIDSLTEAAPITKLAVDFPTTVISPAAGNVELKGRRSGAPLALVQYGRRQWSVLGTIDQIMRRQFELSRRFPDVDWVLFRSLNARMEGALFAAKDRPENILSSPPLPWPEYAAVLREARVVITDCPVLAHEATCSGIPVMGLGNEGVSPWPAGDSSEAVRFTTPATLHEANLDDWLEGPVTEHAKPVNGLADFAKAREFLENWFKQPV